jgi:hypothetical protein
MQCSIFGGEFSENFRMEQAAAQGNRFLQSPYIRRIRILGGYWQRGIVSDYHFHIYWTARKFFEPDVFETRAQGVAHALELAVPGEVFNVREFPADCPVCARREKLEIPN